MNEVIPIHQQASVALGICCNSVSLAARRSHIVFVTTCHDGMLNMCTCAMCVCRLFDFTKQQQLVLKLQKQFPKEQYQWWLVDTLLLQARAAATAATAAGGGGGGLGCDQLLQLGASMMWKLLQQGKGSREEVVLYLGGLLAQVREGGRFSLGGGG